MPYNCRGRQAVGSPDDRFKGCHRLLYPLGSLVSQLGHRTRVGWARARLQYSEHVHDPLAGCRCDEGLSPLHAGPARAGFASRQGLPAYPIAARTAGTSPTEDANPAEGAALCRTTPVAGRLWGPLMTGLRDATACSTH